MSKSDAWIFNILILIGLLVLSFAIGSFIPSFFAIFGILSLAIGIYIGFKSTGTSREEEILDSQEIPVEIDQIKPSEVLKKEQTLNNQEVLIVDDQNKSSEVSESSDNSLRQSKALAIKMKIREKGDNKEEIEDRTESSNERINNIQGWGNKTTKTDLTFIVIGILLLLISSFVSRVSSISTIFSYLGFLSIGIGLYLVLKSVLRAEQVIDNWGIMIEKGNGKAEEIFILAEAFMKSSKAPSLKIHRKEMSPGLIRGILGTNREFLIATDKNFRLNPYQIFINARDYGNNLDVS